MSLAGEGCNLRVFEGSSCTLLISVPVFGSQVIHGINCQSNTEAHASRCLVWGGRSIRIISLSSAKDNHGYSDLKCCFLTVELLVDDWLLDAALLSGIGNGACNNNLCPDAVLLTAHNVLYSLHLHVDFEPTFLSIGSIAFLASGPCSILYSAHLAVLDTGQILVACGTVFGEVLVWRCDLHAYLKDRGAVVEAHLLQAFHGHEGSVFGVRISEVPVDTLSGDFMWLVASCSDDRTVRVWKLANVLDSENDRTSLETFAVHTETGLEYSVPENSVRPTAYLATAMGHTSRIWCLHFIHCPQRIPKLISFGEDSTSQLWNLVDNSSGGEPLNYVLYNEDIFKYHVGKNIWASSVNNGKDSSHTVLTGGADARIVTYNVLSQGHGSNGESIWRGRSHLSSLRTVPVQSQSPDPVTSVDSADSAISPTKQAFNALQGHWRIHRVLQSAISTSPSGVFQGMARFVLRTPTDLQYQGEYAYFEDGEFSTDTGLCIKSRRRYVYRYQEASDSITAWFVKTDNEADVDYLFHEVKFCEPPSVLRDVVMSDTMSNCTAFGYHLCIEDRYSAKYVFYFCRRSMRKFSVKFVVKGPRKDYTADATYEELPGKNHEHNSSTTVPGHKNYRKLTHIPSTRFQDDCFKCYCWIGPRDLLCSSAQGCIMHATLGSTCVPKEQALSDELREISWNFIGHLPELRLYSVATGLSGNVAFFAGSCGTVFRYQASVRSIDTIAKLPRKVAGLFAEQIPMSSCEYSDFTAVVASCIGGSDAYLLLFKTGDVTLSQSFQLARLEMPHDFVVTSAHFISREHVLALGSRNGAMALYDCCYLRNTIYVKPSSYTLQIHNKDAVTAIQEIPQGDRNSAHILLLTTGRDGKFCAHQVHIERNESFMGVTMETVHIADPPFGPAIEGAIFDSTTNDLLMWGFRSTDFVVWNNTKQAEVMKVPCAGSHRNWAYDPHNDGTDGGNFVWTKASVCNVHMQRQASHRILQSGGHGREIKAVAITPVPIEFEETDGYLIATGAEDTTIRISLLDEPLKDAPNVPRCLGVITRHKTGIQQLRWSADGRFLFSAGGREEFFLWKIRLLPCLGIGVVCALQVPPVTESLELRVMNFDAFATRNGTDTSPVVSFVVIIVYSDSTVRVGRKSIQNTCAQLIFSGLGTQC